MNHMNPHSEDQKVIIAVKKSLPAVVSIMISKNVPRVEKKNFFTAIPKKETKKPFVGAGRGFSILPDAMKII